MSIILSAPGCPVNPAPVAGDPPVAACPVNEHSSPRCWQFLQIGCVSSHLTRRRLQVVHPCRDLLWGRRFDDLGFPMLVLALLLDLLGGEASEETEGLMSDSEAIVTG